MTAVAHATVETPAPQVLLAAGLDQIDQGLTVFDSDLRMVAWNKRFLELLEFPDGLAHQGAAFEDFIRYNAERGEYGEDDIDAAVSRRVEQAKDFEPHDFERVRPDGRVIRVKGSPITGGGFVTIYTDVTQRRNQQILQEELIAERAEALRLSEERLRLIANEVPAGIAHVDKDLCIRYANDRFARAYGKTPDELIGCFCRDVLAKATLDFSAPFFEQTRRGGRVDFDMTLTLPSGQVREIRTFLRPEQPSRGEVIGFYLVSVDVTRQKQATAAMLQAQKMDAVGQMSSGIAHDFNNLLTVIIGNLSPLTERLAESELRRELVEPALKAARRGADLTRRLLAVARRQPLKPTAVDLGDTIGDLIKLLRPSLPDNIELHSHFRGRTHPAFVDGAQLEMALLNLAINARDALKGGGRIEFSTSIRQVNPELGQTLRIKSGNYVEISVCDNGPGMPEEISTKIFEPFFSTKSDGGGSGLGLSMVYGFARQSNGSIRVESSPGKGTVFHLLLPVAEETASFHWVDTPEPPSSTQGDIRGLVLLVEDSEEVRNVVRRQLVELGHRIVEAETADEALELIDSLENIDMLISDVAMPGALSGIDLAHRVRMERPEIHVLLMTGHSGILESTSAEDDFFLLRKPFETVELADAIAAQTLRRGHAEA